MPTTLNPGNQVTGLKNANSSVSCFPVMADSIVAYLINMHVMRALVCMRVVLIVSSAVSLSLKVCRAASLSASMS